jgi:hypothetical protein
MAMAWPDVVWEELPLSDDERAQVEGPFSVRLFGICGHRRNDLRQHHQSHRVAVVASGLIEDRSGKAHP